MKLLLSTLWLLLSGCAFDLSGVAAWEGGTPDGPADLARDVPDAAAVDAVRPDQADGSVLDLTGPDQTGSDVHLPDAATPDGATTDAATPDGATTDAAPPDVAVPDIAVPDVAVPDVAVPDVAVPDVAVPDVALPDLPPPDQAWPPDKGAIVPISAATLGNAFANTQVQCVLYDGTVQSNTIPVADSASVSFFNGTVTLAGAGQPTISWVGGQPSVIVVWDPNACDWEDPPGGTSWSSGGLLIRGATLNASNELVLAPGTTAQDINTLNVNSDGTFQVDYFEPDDSKLSDFPQLVNPVTKAKELILQLGNV